jgi:hypothetical protein
LIVALACALATVMAVGRSQGPAPAGRLAATGPEAASTGPATRPVSTQPYLVHRAEGKITIDGADHPEQWKTAQVLGDFRIPGSLDDARSRTSAQLLWDDQCLYLRITAEDQDLRGTFTARTDPLYQEDVVEFFFKPYADKGYYYEFEVNPINTVMALQIADRRRQTLEERSRWETGIRSAVEVGGTINQPEDRDRLYRVVMAIPFKNLKLMEGKAPVPGDRWRFALCRYDYSAYLRRSPELSSCAPLSRPDFHMYEEYLTLVFAR